VLCVVGEIGGCLFVTRVSLLLELSLYQLVELLREGVSIGGSMAYRAIRNKCLFAWDWVEVRDWTSGCVMSGGGPSARDDEEGMVVPPSCSTRCKVVAVPC
jgi:hypothetical protein